MIMFDLIDFSQSSFDEAHRLFHGRGHAYPGYEHLSIDWLSPVALITLYKEESSVFLQDLAQQLFDAIEPCTSVQVQYRYLRESPFELLLGEPVTETTVLENGLKYHITLGRSQNTGLFLDMRSGRKWVQEHAKNARVLNLFAYTCAFSVASLAGQAERVLNVDLSRASLTAGRENHRLNNQDLTKVNFQSVDIFKSFGRIKKYGPYDLLVCDPPSFQKGSVDIKRDYKKIIRRLPEFMNPNSLLMLCLNDPDLDELFLKEMVALECPSCEYIESIATPDVFVETMSGKGLKVAIYRYQAQS